MIYVVPNVVPNVIHMPLSYNERSQWQLLLLKHVIYSENYKRHTSSVVYLLRASLVRYRVLYNRGGYEYYREMTSGHDLGPDGLGDLGKHCSLVPHAY